MSREIDITRPGPAGLYFDHNSLTDAGKASDRAIMASLIMAGDDTAAIRLIREAQARIEAALAAVEVRT